MTDTHPQIAELVARRHAAMTPLQRMQIASDLFDTARAIIESSLPDSMTPYERRLAVVACLYGDALPLAAQEAFARNGINDVRD